MSRVTVKAFGKAPAGIATGRCLCGKVQVEISIPTFWAWHDHSRATRRAHGAAYATYVGCWRSRFRVAKGERQLTRFEDEATGDARAYCSRCGTPVAYTRGRSSKMVNIPRALFDGRTGRQPLYHVAIGDSPEVSRQLEGQRLEVVLLPQREYVASEQGIGNTRSRSDRLETVAHDVRDDEAMHARRL